MKELAAYLKVNPNPDRGYPVLLSPKRNWRRQAFLANTLCQLITKLEDHRDTGGNDPFGSILFHSLA